MFLLALLTVGVSLFAVPYRSVSVLRDQIESERLLIPVFLETTTDSTTLCFEASAQMAHLYQSQVLRAVDYLRDAQIHAPNPAPLLLLARSYCWLGEPEKAAFLFKQYSILQPDNVAGRLWWWRSLGQALQDKKNWDEAVQVYQQAIAEFPRAADLRVNLGIVFFRRGDGLDAAAQEIQRGIAIDPQGQFYLNMGRLLTEAGRFDEADSWYLKGIEVEPHFPWGYQLRADSTWQAGDMPRAMQMYQQIVHDFPDFPQGYYQLAWAYRLSEQRDPAIAAIERALALMVPPDAWYYVRAAEIYDWAGDKAKALLAYQQALELDATNAVAIQGVQRLAGK